jgi:hypothetical protein
VMLRCSTQPSTRSGCPAAAKCSTSACTAANARSTWCHAASHDERRASLVAAAPHLRRGTWDIWLAAHPPHTQQESWLPAIVDQPPPATHAIARRLQMLVPDCCCASMLTVRMHLCAPAHLLPVQPPAQPTA